MAKARMARASERDDWADSVSGAWRPAMFASACGSMGRGNCRCGEMVLPCHRPNASAPKIAGHAKQVSQFLQTERFDHISVGAEAISLIGIRFVSSGTEQDNRHLRRFRVASHPAK